MSSGRRRSSYHLPKAQASYLATPKELTLAWPRSLVGISEKCQFFQAFSGRCLVAALGHRQHRGPLRVGQVGQDRDEQLVPLLQAQLVDAHVLDDPAGIDLLGLGVGQLVTDDQADHLGGDAQPPSHLLLVATDE